MCSILYALLSLCIPVASVVAGDSVPDVRTNEVVRRRVALLLAERAIKKQGFAKAAARTPSWVPMFLRGKRPFPFDRIDEVASFFQHSPEALIAQLTDDEVKRSDEALKQLRRRRPEPRAMKRSVAS
jgi:hypothetical protein